MSKQFAVGLFLRLIVLACLGASAWAAYKQVFWLVYPLASASVVAMLCFVAEEFKREVRQ